MCESQRAILSAIFVLLTVIILILVYLLTEKICLWEINSSSLPDTKFLQFTSVKELRDTPLSWTVKITELGIYFAEEPHRLRSWISLWLIFCGSRPVPRLVDSGTTV